MPAQLGDGGGNCVESVGNTTTITRPGTPRSRSLGNLYNKVTGTCLGTSCERREEISIPLIYQQLPKQLPVRLLYELPSERRCAVIGRVIVVAILLFLAQLPL